MRTFFSAVAALGCGMLLGAWQPRGELLTARAELSALRDQPCRRSAADRVRSLLTADRPAAPARDAAPSSDPATPPDETPADDEAPSVAPRAEPPASAEDQRALMAEVLGARRSQARQALREQAGLDGDQIAQVDRVMDEMNAQLKIEIDAFVEDSIERGTVERRDMMEIAAVSLDAMIAASDSLTDLLPADADVDEDARDPLSYIDASTVEALTRLEGFDDPESR